MDQINTAYRRALRHLHPDTRPAAQPPEIKQVHSMAELQAARRDLLRRAEQHQIKQRTEHRHAQQRSEYQRAGQQCREGSHSTRSTAYRPGPGEPDIFAGPEHWWPGTRTREQR